MESPFRLPREVLHLVFTFAAQEDRPNLWKGLAREIRPCVTSAKTKRSTMDLDLASFPALIDVQLQIDTPQLRRMFRLGSLKTFGLLVCRVLATDADALSLPRVPASLSLPNLQSIWVTVGSQADCDAVADLVARCESLCCIQVHGEHHQELHLAVKHATLRRVAVSRVASVEVDVPNARSMELAVRDTMTATRTPHLTNLILVRPSLCVYHPLSLGLTSLTLDAPRHYAQSPHADKVYGSVRLHQTFRFLTTLRAQGVSFDLDFARLPALVTACFDYCDFGSMKPADVCRAVEWHSTIQQFEFVAGTLSEDMYHEWEAAILAMSGVQYCNAVPERGFIDLTVHF